MSEIKLTFRWSDKASEGRMSEADSARLVQMGDITALDFVQDVIADAQALYDVLHRSVFHPAITAGEAENG